jgi:valyl-tRNA synthetase
MAEPKIKEKRWDLKNEPELFSFWTKEGVFRFNIRSNKSFFSIDTPPPYPSGIWHIGAAAHYSQIDMIARTSRMFNKEVLFPVGIDRNGLPVELYTEKKYNISIRTTPREKFIEFCKTALDELEADMIRVMKRMGLSGDFDHYYRTDSEEYRKLTQATFIELWKKRLIYEDMRPNNYCPKCHTTIADAEIDYQDIPTKLNYIRFKLKGSKKELIIATTRPELLGACAAVLYNPGDARYKDLKGKTAVVPIANKEVPLLANNYAKPEFGSGLVMICSYGDYADVRLFRELKLKENVLIDETGKMTASAGKYKGLKVEEARKAILEDLKTLLVKQEDIVHSTPTCERSKNPIEIIPMKEFYLKQLNFLQTLRNYAQDIKFHPERYRQNLLNWIDSVTTDWPITRRRIYGTEVPVWYCKNCRKPQVPEPGKYYQPWKDKPPFKNCQGCKGTEFVGDERTFDTWMDSSISPLFVTGYGKDKELFKKAFPCGIRPQAKEIIRTWLYYTLLRVHQLTGKQAFANVWIMGHGVDEHGEKMSKSKGNVVDPIPVLEKYGADAFRYWNCSEANLGEDFRYSSSRVENAGKFLTKLWNISRFISAFPQEKTTSVKDSDKWVLAELNSMITKSIAGYGDFNFFVPATAAKNFAWNIFADHYIELVKARAYKGDKAACYTLHTCLKSILKLLAPVCPFMTEKIWLELYSKDSIHKQGFPDLIPQAGIKHLDFTKPLMDFNSAIWKYKKDKGLSLNSELKEVYAKKELKFFEDDLKAMHSIKSLKFTEPQAKGKMTKLENAAIVE